MHAKPRPEHKSGIGGRTADWEGGVSTGTGSWEETEKKQAQLAAEGK